MCTEMCIQNSESGLHMSKSGCLKDVVYLSNYDPDTELVTLLKHYLPTQSSGAPFLNTYVEVSD